MSFPRYSNYKDSGVEWLGQVPAHWEVTPLKRLARLQTGMTPPTEDLDNYTEDEVFQWVRPEDLDEMGAPTKASKFLTEKGWSQTRQIKAGASLICCIGTIGKVGITNDAVSTNQQITAAVPQQDSRYLFYAICAARSALELASTGNVLRILNTERLGNIKFPKPPFPEQIKISVLLDREIAKIDELVAEQRRLMALLKEKRQAVISHAVTRGLNPDAPLKSSGIEWLGDVPAHWVVSRMANVFREVAEPGTDELPILSVSIHHGVSDKEMDDEEMDRKVTRSDDRTKYKQVAPGDLVYNMMRAWQGGFGTVAVAGMVSPAYVVARPKMSVETAYIEHLLRTPKAIEQMRRHSRGITDFRLRLYWDEFKNIGITIPADDEAKAICSEIADMESRFSNLTAACEKSIDLLQERRTALISAAVTGQIDVRALA